MDQPMTPTAALSRRFELPPEPSPQAGSATVDARPHLGFQVGSLALLLAPGALAEVMEVPALFRLPNTPQWCPGLANLRGNLVPVFNLHLLLDEQPGTQSRLLVVGELSEAAGIVIDGLPTSRRLDLKIERGARPPVPELLEPHLGQAFRQGRDFFYELDHLALLRRLVQLMQS